MNTFTMDDLDFEQNVPDIEEPDIPAPSMDILAGEFENEEVMTNVVEESVKEEAQEPVTEPEPVVTPEPTPPPEPSAQPTPDPSSVNLSGMDGSEEKESPTFDFGSENKVDEDNIFNRKFPVAQEKEEKADYNQKKTDTIPKETKDIFSQIIAFVFVFLMFAGIVVCLTLVNKKEEKKGNKGNDVFTNNKDATITEQTTTPPAKQTNRWEPGIVDKSLQTDTVAATQTTTEVTTQSTTEANTEAFISTEEGGVVKPTDERFPEVADLTLYIQNSSSIIYRKAQEIVQSYVDGQTDRETYLSTLNTYKTAYSELSRLLIMNHACYDNDEDTYKTLEKYISDGLIYTENASAVVDEPLSEIMSKLEK